MGVGSKCFGSIECYDKLPIERNKKKGELFLNNSPDKIFICLNACFVLYIIV